MTATTEPSTADEDPKNILAEALSVHDSSDDDEENKDSEEKNKNSDQTFVVETANESEIQKESKITGENNANLVRVHKIQVAPQANQIPSFCMNLKRCHIYNLFKHFSCKRISFIADK